MAKLRDMVVNVIPKLDVRKANEMGKKLGKIMGKASDVFKKGTSFVGKAGIALNQGVQLFQQIEALINKPRGEVNNALGFADQIADTAVALGTTSARLDQVLGTLSKGGAAAPQTLELLKKYAARAEELGLEGDIDEMFLNELDQLSKMSGADRLKRIKDVFGHRSVIDAQDAVEAMKLWFQNRTDARENLAQGAAYDKLAASAGEKDNINFMGMRKAVRIVSEKGLDAAALELERQDNRERNMALASTTPQAMVTAGKTLSEIKIALTTGINKIIEIGSKIEQAFGVFEKMNGAIQSLSNAIRNMNPFSWGKNK